MNCVVVTNIRGSAGNQIDIPIEKDIFKINDEAENFHVGLQLTLERIRANPSKYLAMQTSYRAKILEGKDLFVAEVDHLIKETTTRKSNFGAQIGRTEMVLIEHIAESIQERDAIIQERDAIIQERDAIIQERDAIIQERDAIIQERDAIIQERDASISNFRNVLNSVSWKVTRPLRFLHRTLSSFSEKI